MDINKYFVEIPSFLTILNTINIHIEKLYLWFN